MQSGVEAQDESRGKSLSGSECSSGNKRRQGVLIEVLYVPGCPNHVSAVRRLRGILQSEGIDAPISEIAVTDETMARTLCFPGSPTVRINGIDAEPSGAESSGLACRLYANGSGVPSQETLQRAVSIARKKEVSL